jgi:uncharacterized protein (DUF1800 family)
MRSLVRLSTASLLFLVGCSSATSHSSLPRGTAPTPIVVVPASEPRDLTADEQVHQVLDRLAFGGRPGDAARVRAMGVDRWIGLQLAPDRIDDAATERMLASYAMLSRPTTELVAMYDEGQRALRERGRMLAQQGDTGTKKDLRAELLRNDPQLREQLRRNQRIAGDVQSAKLARAVTSERQLEEVMTDFWENHFTVCACKGQTRLFISSYDRDVIRPRALGKFRDLLGAVAKSPAMLFYLDQWQSAADVPQRAPQARARRGLNENYARELLELHTLGVDGGYSQKDVIEVARALTGWTMNPRQEAEFVFRPAIHDTGQKIVLGHLLPAGRGIEDGEEVLDILSRDPHTARFVARKLAIRFVSDEPPAALVERAARAFVRTDGDIREVVRTIVTSPEFFGRSAYRSKVKSPFELVASALRAVGAQPDTSMRSAQLVASLGQPLFGHQAPNGWPETGEAWMNSGAILNRINFGLGLAAGRFPGASVARWSEAERLESAPREQQVDAVVSSFFGGRASPDTREILLRGENPMAARGGAPLSGLAQVVGLAVGAPEFQRR